MNKFILACLASAPISAFATPVAPPLTLTEASQYTHSAFAGKLISISEPYLFGSDYVVALKLDTHTQFRVETDTLTDAANSLCDLNKPWALDNHNNFLCIAN